MLQILPMSSDIKIFDNKWVGFLSKKLSNLFHILCWIPRTHIWIPFCLVLVPKLKKTTHFSWVLSWNPQAKELHFLNDSGLWNLIFNYALRLKQTHIMSYKSGKVWAFKMRTKFRLRLCVFGVCTRLLIAIATLAITNSVS